MSTWRAYPGGMDLLARRLAEDLDVVTGQPVEEVAADGAGARLTVGGRTLTARDVVLAVPAPSPCACTPIRRRTRPVTSPRARSGRC